MRLIDGDELLEHVWRDRLDTRERIANLVKSMPTIKPRNGKWIDEGFYADGHGAHVFRCPECGGRIIEYDVDPFCRWCGAPMESERDD